MGQGLAGLADLAGHWANPGKIQVFVENHTTTELVSR